MAVMALYPPIYFGSAPLGPVHPVWFAAWGPAVDEFAHASGSSSLRGPVRFSAHRRVLYPGKPSLPALPLPMLRATSAWSPA
jgi:hypothetical protein